MRRCAPLVPLALLALVARIAAAQDFVDRGVFVIERGNAETGRVEFAVRRTSGSQGRGGFLLVAATRTAAHEVEYALELSRDSVPVTFTQTETTSGRIVRRVSATLSGHRFSARASSSDAEVSREMPVSPPLLILGDEDYTAYAFLPQPDPGQSRAVTVIRARDLEPAAAQVLGMGHDTLRIASRFVPCRRFTLRLADGEERQFWLASGGMLVRVAQPATGLVATRTEISLP
jgi:hypothetical protein